MTPVDAAREAHNTSTDNILLAAASPLLNTIVHIRMAATHDDPAGLRLQLVEEVRQFENRCKQAGLPFETIIGARYCLCSTLDEAAAQTPWGIRGVWSGNGLLVTFHNESWGGEKFFQLLSRLSQNPAQHLALLEVIHYCLLLGYEGRYRGIENGRQQRDTLRTRLGQLIAETRQDQNTPTSVTVEARPLSSQFWRPPVPIWSCLLITALIAGLIYSGLNWRLGSQAEPVLRAIYQAPLPEVTLSRGAATPQSLLNLRQRLSDVLAAGQLEVSDGAFGSKIILSSDKLFEPGATALNSSGRALLMRVADAVQDIKGTLLVSAYTDNRVPRTNRFPSSYEFSLARAKTIAALLNQQLTAGHQIKAEGRGDSDPLLPNDSEENRARNRRIEITLFAAPVNPAQKEKP
ncbi:type IVB secretion system protein IcmH/DotU [Pantoea sp. FN0307]|uniref:type IVB secretion system protein IcmH/DotU n=1 Tax=Pantoea sp. FN0307 TaxID=3418560 RepID=UPI003CF3F7D3